MVKLQTNTKAMFGMPHYGVLELCIVFKYYNTMFGTYPDCIKKKNNAGNTT